MYSSVVSIPLEQGNVFRPTLRDKVVALGLSLNPFGTGQCLSTQNASTNNFSKESLNPFGTGQCLSTTMLMNF